jgi:hypothetical protein
MTQSRWLAACAATLLLGGAALAQAPCNCMPCPPCPAQPSEASRAPFYNELPQILFPAQAPVLCPNSNPVVWAHLFEAVAGKCCRTCRVNVSCNPRERCRTEVQNRRMAFELLKLYRVFYREGHYHAAEIVAGRALQLDPSNGAADAALCMARMATDAIDHAEGMCGDYEDCEADTIPAPRCGMCVVSGAACGACEGCCERDTKACCKKAAKTSCACGEDCPCCKDEPCACGAKCGCKKTGRQNVRNDAAPRVIVIQVPAMMCPPCPVCPGLQAALPHPVPAMIPHPIPGMMPPPMNFAPPPMNFAPPPMDARVPDYGYQPVPPPGYTPWRPTPMAEQLPRPRMVEAPVPGVMGLMCGAANTPAPDAMKITVCGKQVSITCPSLKACCDTVTALPDGRALLEGNVSVTFTRDDRPAKIKAQRMIVDLEDGSYEVSPPQASEPALKPIGFKECVLVGGKKLVPALKKRFCPGSTCPPCGTCPVPVKPMPYGD